jgi:ketosteroid isomerase-like protein
MKNVKLVSMLSVLLSNSNCKGQSPAQTKEVDAVKAVIISFSKAGDTNNVTELNKYLDDNFRIVMNRLFGSTGVSVMPKALYVEKIKTKEFGGDTRALTFENVVINGTTASVKVTFKGSKMTFVSLITLVKNEAGSWKLVSDTPVVI